MKEDKKMKYEKPVVALVTTALKAVQGNPPGSKMGGPSDHFVQVTASAYEADE